MPSFKCKDVGMKDSFEVKTETMEEMMDVITAHAKKAHNISPPFPEDMMEKVKKAIKK